MIEGVVLCPGACSLIKYPIREEYYNKYMKNVYFIIALFKKSCIKKHINYFQDQELQKVVTVHFLL